MTKAKGGVEEEPRRGCLRHDHVSPLVSVLSVRSMGLKILRQYFCDSGGFGSGRGVRTHAMGLRQFLQLILQGTQCSLWPS